MKQKRTWLSALHRALEPYLVPLGFRRAARYSFVRESAEVCDRYGFQVRHARHSDDPHSMYVDPWVSTTIPRVSALALRLSGDPRYAEAATVGASFGLLKLTGSNQEWPVDGIESAMALVPPFMEDVRLHGTRFWHLFSSPERIVHVVESGHPWYREVNESGWGWIATLCLAKGIGATLEYFHKNRKKFWALDRSKVPDALGQLRNDPEWGSCLPGGAGK